MNHTDPEIRGAIKQAVDIIDASAEGLGQSRGEVALRLLRENNLPLLTKKVALRVKAEELISQNPSRVELASGFQSF